MLKVLADKSVKPVHIFVIRYTFPFEVKAVVVNPKLHNPTKQLKTCGIFFIKRAYSSLKLNKNFTYM